MKQSEIDLNQIKILAEKLLIEKNLKWLNGQKLDRILRYSIKLKKDHNFDIPADSQSISQGLKKDIIFVFSYSSFFIGLRMFFVPSY